jgi:hypothetical protein
LREAAEEFAASVADSAALIERVKLLQEELAALGNEQTSRTLFVLTVVTVLALPINLVAGLFGMNVGGVPFGNNGGGFWVVVAALAVMTAITPDDKTLFLAMQSPLDYPTPALGRASRSVRILKFDIGSERITGEFVYFFDEVCAFLREPAGCSVVPGEMKISGLVALTASSFLVLERTDTAAKVYRVDASRATDILNSAWDAVAASPGASTPALESLTNPTSQGIAVLPKTLVIDLSTLPDMPDKIEGIAVVHGRPDLLAVANDNDFGLVDNAAFDTAGRLSNDTRVRSKLIYVELAAPVN